MASRTRSGRLTPPRDLTPATGARTTRLRRPRSCRSSGALASAHRSLDPPCDRGCAPGAFASTASHPNVRDDRDPPLMRDETGEVIRLIWVFSEMESFCSRGWTDSCAARPSGKSACDQLAGRISISVMRHSVRYISSVHISACERDRRVMQGGASARRRSRLLVSRRILPLRLQ